MPRRNLYPPGCWPGANNNPYRPPWRWPAMKGLMAWDGNILDPSEVTYQLSSTDIVEIEQALESFKDMDLDGPETSTKNFALASLGPKLLAFAKAIHYGRGFYIVRGLNLANYSIEDSTLIFLGISSYIGEQRAMQNPLGDMITHICEPVEKNCRSYRFHTESDMCDIVAFHVRSQKDEVFKLASSWRVYNQLRHAKGKILDKFANFPQQERFSKPRTCFAQEEYRTDLFLYDGKAILSYTGSCASDSFFGTYDLGPTQDVAMKAAESHVAIRLREGDLLFINNLALLHAIDDNQDEDRHLVKLWLRNGSLAWKLPPGMQESMDDLFQSKKTRRIWALRPNKRGGKGRKTGNSPEFSATVNVKVEAGDDGSDGASVGGMSAGGGSFGGGSFGGGGWSMGGWS